jgi:hypothetical protein
MACKFRVTVQIPRGPKAEISVQTFGGRRPSEAGRAYYCVPPLNLEKFVSELQEIVIAILESTKTVAPDLMSGFRFYPSDSSKFPQPLFEFGFQANNPYISFSRRDQIEKTRKVLLLSELGLAYIAPISSGSHLHTLESIARERNPPHPTGPMLKRILKVFYTMRLCLVTAGRLQGPLTPLYDHAIHEYYRMTLRFKLEGGTPAGGVPPRK